MDEAGHILCAFTYSDLFSHPHPLRSWWWGKLLTVNNFYPPAVYAFNGMLKLALGPAHWVDWLSLGIYDFVLSFSIFATTVVLTGRRLAGIAAAFAINMYAEMVFLSHTFLLDFQVGAMISLGLFCMVWWAEKPTWKKAVFCGLSLALVLATKQIAGAFLIGPGLYYFIASLRKREAHWQIHLFQLVVMALIAAISMVPWVVASYGFISEFAETNKKVITSTVGAVTVPQALIRGIRFYATAIPQMMTPFLFGVFVVSLSFCSLRTHRRLLPTLIGSVVGILLISCLPWQYPQQRYIAGALIAPAIYSGVLINRLWRVDFKALPALPKVLTGFISITAILQFASMCFFPYPFAGPTFMVRLSDWLGAKVSMMVYDKPGKATPAPYQDWGQKWVLSIIEKRDPGLPVWLNVMANHLEYNPHTFTLLGKEMHSKVKPTSSRTWTVLGDTVSYSKDSALYYQWYLLKSGNTGYALLNEESKVANEKILDFVKNSGKFDLKGQRKVPDGSEIFLYRQK